MTGFKNKIFLLFLCACACTANAQEKVYLIPPVQLLPLKKMETNSYGITVADENDFLNEAVWENTAYPLIATKISQVPDDLPAQAQELFLKLLKLTAEAPQGTAGQSFITLKLQTLFDRGQFEDVYKLIQKIPEMQRTEAQNKIYTDTLLSKNLKNACSAAKMENGEAYEQEMTAVCAALNHDEDKAFLALELLKERGRDDPFIANAVDAFLYGKPLTVFPVELTPLTVSVWRQCGRKTAELRKKDSPVWFKAMFVRDETVPAEERLAVVEELVQKGLFLPAGLRTLYQQIRFKDGKTASLSEELKRAKSIQQAAELSSSPQDNLKKQAFFRQGLASAEKSHISYAFSAAAKDILETLKPDVDTLEKSSDIIKAFTLAGLHKQAVDWYKKAEILFPVSETTAGGWYYAELSKPDKASRLFIPALQNMMSYEEKNSPINKAFIAKTDRLMLTFETLRMIQPDESWHYTSFAEESDENGFIHPETATTDPKRPAGDIVLEALRSVDGTYIGLLNALSVLTKAGLNGEAAEMAAQSTDLILNPAASDE